MVELAKRYKVIFMVVIVFIIWIVCETVLLKPNDRVELIKHPDANSLSLEQMQYDSVNTNSIYSSSDSILYKNPMDEGIIKTAGDMVVINEKDEANEVVIGNIKEEPITEKLITDEITIIPVYICGEVVNPGVYNVNSDKLINDVVNLAGGLTEDANLQGVNLAEVIYANDMIIVPKIGEDVPAPKLSKDNPVTIQQSTVHVEETYVDRTSGLININTASKDSLMNLPGIGEVKAQAIIDYRESVSMFMSISDIKEVSGIGDKTFEKLAPLITV